jgi:hypothetical protein
VQRALDWIAQDAEYCEWYGRAHALPLFNLTGVNCTQYVNCSVSAPVAGRVDGPWQATLPDGSSLASRYDYNETLDVTVLTQCTTPPSAAAAPYPNLQGLNWQTRRGRQLLRQGGSAGAGEAAAVAASAAAAAGAPPPPLQ